SYLGVFNWDAGVYDPEVPYAGPLPDPPAVDTQKNLSYRSALHSIEVNAQPLTDGALQAFTGFRYLLLDESVSDLLDESSQPPLIPPNAANAVVGDPPMDVTDILRSMNVDNHLIGFQLGLRTDRLQIWGPLYLEGFVNAGAYCNFVQRKSIYSETRTYNALDDPSTAASEAVLSVSTTQTGYKADRMRGAFVAEAVLGGVYQINRCTRGRIGYQVLSLMGVELGDTAFIGAAPTGEDLLLHGWYAGVEYRR
ncbi:MAG: hypothetical protein KDA37_14785, partial [Planctomycetales bacterium]|nr:hypothetical protein [Planctomycetales bacterium]